MKSTILKPKHFKHKAANKKRSPDVLDKENIPPTEGNLYKTQLPLVAAKKSKRVTSFNGATNKTAKIRKNNTNIDKTKAMKRLYQNCNHDGDNKTKNKKQEEGEEKGRNLVSPIITSNIDLISRRLKDNMTKATYNMMACLILSNQPCDQHLYEKVFKSLNSSNVLSYNENDRNNESLMSGMATESHIINIPSLSLMCKEDNTLNFTPIFDHSFDIDQENEFINAWLQHGSSGSEYSSNSFDPNDSFSIATEQELSELLLQHNAFL